MGYHLAAGVLLMVGLLLMLWPAYHMLSGLDDEEISRARLRKAALREWMRRQAHEEWINGPIGRSKPNRHDRARKEYAETFPQGGGK